MSPATVALSLRRAANGSWDILDATGEMATFPTFSAALAAAQELHAERRANARTYAVKCDDCQTTLRTTIDLGESAAGGRCQACRKVTA